MVIVVILYNRITYFVVYVEQEGVHSCKDNYPWMKKNETTIISYYFGQGYRYETIIQFLITYHKINISLSTLKRRLRVIGLRKNDISPSTEEAVRCIIRNELHGPSRMKGYRSMWNMLRTTYHMTVPRNMVMKILKEEDKNGAFLFI